MVSVDANFGLVRKKSSGTSYLPPCNTSSYFMESSKVADDDPSSTSIDTVSFTV